MSLRLISIICLCLGFAAKAQTIDINISLPPQDKYKEARVFFLPLGASAEPQELRVSHDNQNIITGQVKANAEGLYYIYANDSDAWVSLPVYIKPGTNEAFFGFAIEKGIPSTSMTDDVNQSLTAYEKVLINKAFIFERNNSEIPESLLKSTLQSYSTAADSILAVHQLPENIRQYISLWAYTTECEAIHLTNYLANRAGRDLVIEQSELLPDPSAVLDCPMALSFSSLYQIISNTLPKGRMEERLATLYANYKTPEIRKHMADLLVKTFLSNYDYSKGYEQGLKCVTDVVNKYDLSQDLINTYKSHYATLKGQPFPEAILIDRDGNPVDFSKYKGKYVYIDMWASWCVPCRNEIPHLQSLEAELQQGGNVEFVSISVDTTKEPWLKALDQLQLQGNQLWMGNSDLTASLNVRGIPHFLIYDPNGNLYMYNAPRPSEPETKALLQSLKL